MEKISIGIEVRLDMPVLELALQAMMEGTQSPEYYQELAASQCNGPNRTKKIVTSINRYTLRSKLAPYIRKHKTAVSAMLKTVVDRRLALVAVMCCGYSIFYDTVSILGKYFHAQQQVTKDLLERKLGAIYGGNRALPKAYNCVIPMLMEVGFISRPQPGVYEICRQENFSDQALDIYKHSFVINNPYYSVDDDIETNSYFEFLR